MGPDRDVMHGAYYNENDPFAAAWLEKLIKRGLIAQGVVDTRSIVDVRPDDVREFTQCHFFAGIGVWSYALRLAGWPDGRRVWTGSCPCGPFSQAGKGTGFADERHLWPAFHHLIAECRPRVAFGEQVASPVGLAWVDLVQSDMEAADYAFAALDLCAAGFGAPHLRQRLYWLAYTYRQPGRQGGPQLGRIVARGDAQPWAGPWRDGGLGVVVDSERARLEGYPGHGDDAAGRPIEAGSIAATGATRALANANDNEQRSGRGAGREDRAGDEPGIEPGGRRETGGLDHANGNALPGPVNGIWRDADWLFCRDGKWRPVEPGTFPLAHGAPARVGRLRGYGNAIVAQVAAEFIAAAIDLVP